MSTPDHDHDPRHIHQTLSRTTTFWRGYTLQELLLFGIPPFLGIIILGIPLTPGSLLYPVIGLVIGLEVLFWLLHKTTPAYMRLTEWVSVRLRWAAKDQQYDLGGIDDPGILTPDGGADTAQVTRLKRITPTSVIRTDGAHVGAVKIHPANMALQDDDSWAQAINSLARLVNGALDENLQAKLYTPTRQLDNDQFVRDHQDRLDDEDVQSLPVLEALLERFVERHTTDKGHVTREQSLIREYYLIIWVTDDVVDTDSEATLVGTLRDLPAIGTIVDLVAGRGITQAEIEELKAERLQDKLRTVHSSSEDLYQCSAEPVTGPELAELVAEYHTCRAIDYEDPDTALGGTSLAHYDRGADAVDSDDDTVEDPGDRHQSDSAGPADVDDTEPDVDHEAPRDTAQGPAAVEDDDEAPILDGQVLQTAAEQQQTAVAPAAIDWHHDHTLVEGDTYARTFWIEAFPEEPVDGLFEDVLLSAELDADLSIYIDPYAAPSAVDLISDWIATLRVNKADMGRLAREDAEIDIERAKFIRQLVRRNKTSMVRLGAFIRITADDEETLRHRTNKLETKLRDAPTNCVVKRVSRRPEEGWVTCSPIGANELGSDRLSVGTGEAVGAMFPFSSNYLRMDDGIEYGAHAHNGSPVHIDPWSLETGHSELITGTPGSGKTHGAQARGLRSLKRHDDVKQVIIDPPGDMRGTAAELDAKMITVSGDTPLNPFEMHPTPDHILEETDVNPVTAKKEESFAFIENFLMSQSGVDLEIRSGLVTYIIDRIFEQSGIDPEDTATHTPENSPTMADFLEVLRELADHPEQFSESPSVQHRVEEYAADLRVAFQPFTEGSTHENMAAESQLDTLTTDDKLVYLDLLQVEESPDGLGKQSYIMQLLLTKIYQQAKVIDERVEVIIDEAYYLFNDDANLAFLTQIARHQRHAGLRLVLLSQTLDDFYDTDAEVVEKIAGMCPIQVHHREPQLDSETAADAELTSEQQAFIRERAEAGKESQGYANALVRVDEHGDYPLRIETSPEEKAIIEYDERGGLLEELAGEQDDGMAAFRSLLRERYLQNTLDQHGFAGETIDRLLEDGLSDRELLAVIKLVVEEFGDGWAFDPEAVDTGDPSLLDDVFEQIGDSAGTNGDDQDLKDWSLFEDGDRVEPSQSDDD